TRWLATPRMTSRLRNPPRCHSSRRASETTSGSRTSPPETVPGGSGTCATRTRLGGTDFIDSSAARTPVAPISSPTRTLDIYAAPSSLTHSVSDRSLRHQADDPRQAMSNVLVFEPFGPELE